MDYELISHTSLFQGCSLAETEKLLHGLKTFTKKYKKGAPVYLAGTPVTDIGIVLYGTVQIENNDLWGNKSILSHGGSRAGVCRNLCPVRRAADGGCGRRGAVRNFMAGSCTHAAAAKHCRQLVPQVFAQPVTAFYAEKPDALPNASGAPHQKVRVGGC